MALFPDLRGRIVSIDTETAQLGDKVCEIGISVFYDGKLQGEWGTLINPEIPIEPGASNVHKIFDQDVQDKPKFADVAFNIYQYLQFADIIIAFNSQYDRMVLGKEFDRLGMPWPNKPIIDPFVLFKQFYKFNKGKKLTNMAELFGFQYMGAHRAVNDATMCGRCFFRLAEIQTKFPKTLPELLKNQRTWIQKQYEDYLSWCQANGKRLPDVPLYHFYEFNL